MYINPVVGLSVCLSVTSNIFRLKSERHETRHVGPLGTREGSRPDAKRTKRLVRNNLIYGLYSCYRKNNIKLGSMKKGERAAPANSMAFYGFIHGLIFSSKYVKYLNYTSILDSRNFHRQAPAPSSLIYTISLTPTQHHSLSK